MRAYENGDECSLSELRHLVKRLSLSVEELAALAGTSIAAASALLTDGRVLGYTKTRERVRRFMLRSRRAKTRDDLRLPPIEERK